MSMIAVAAITTVSPFRIGPPESANTLSFTGLLLFQGLGATQSVLHHPIVTFMTSKLVQIFRLLIIGIVPLPRKNDTPRPRVHRRIIDRHDILDRVRIDF